MNRVHLQRIRLLLGVFLLGLVASGVTAIPLPWEVGLLERWVGNCTLIAQTAPGLVSWINRVNEGVQNAYGQHPFLAYGTDWLAFGHVAIAVAFLGPCGAYHRAGHSSTCPLASSASFPCGLRGAPFWSTWEKCDISTLNTGYLSFDDLPRLH